MTLKPAAKVSDYPLELRLQEGHDYSYFFLASFYRRALTFVCNSLKSIVYYTLSRLRNSTNHMVKIEC